MTTMRTLRMLLVPALALAAISFESAVAGRAAQAPPAVATTAVARAGSLVFPSGISGTSGDTLAQVGEVVTRLHETLKAQGLGIGYVLQHTIYLKTGAAPPLAVLQRFHETATRLAPSLKAHPSVGMFVHVPSFTNPRTLVMLDAVAGQPAPGAGAEAFARMPFIVGPKEIVESIRAGSLVFTAGFDAREQATPPMGLDAQLEAVGRRLDAAMTHAGLSIGNMVSHNLYVKKGTAPGDVIRKIHPILARYTQSLKKYPSVGAIVVVDELEDPRSLVELDAVAATGDPASHPRVPLAEVTMDVVRSVEVNGVVFLSSMPGVDFENGSATPADVLQQVDIAVKNVDHSLRKSGLSIGNMAKYKLYLRRGAGDPAVVQARFLEAARRAAPELAKAQIAGTFVIVDSLASNDRLFEASVIARR